MLSVAKHLMRFADRPYKILRYAQDDRAKSGCHPEALEE